MAFSTNIGTHPSLAEIASAINYLLANLPIGRLTSSYSDAGTIAVGDLFVGQISGVIPLGAIVDGSFITAFDSSGAGTQDVPRGTYKFLGGIGINKGCLITRIK